LDTKLQDVIRKVEFLLERAQGSSYPAEAESCQRKAQELMTKYQLESSQLFGVKRDETIIRRDVKMTGAYAIDRITLLNSIARQNFCRVLRGSGYAVIYGYESDIELSLAMFRMLEVDMANQMTLALNEYRSLGGKANAKSWKKSFMAGYANTISERLRDSKREYVDASTGIYALAVRDKEQMIASYFEGVSKSSGASRTLSSTSGWSSGKSSADRADLGQTRISYTRALSS